MTTRDLIGLLAELFLNYRQPFDDAAIAIYERELGHVPLPVLEMAIRHAIRTRKFLPNIAELLEDVDTIRPADPSAQDTFVACGQCAAGWVDAGPGREMQQLAGYDQQGKAIIRATRGSSTLKRCTCWIAWRQSQGLPVPAARPTMHVDEHKGIGQGNNVWTTPRELATSSKVARFQRRFKGETT